MLTDQQIQDLIAQPKAISRKEPARDYREENHQKRCDLVLRSIPEGVQTFTVFVRQNSIFIENFSIGLRYQANHSDVGTVTLTRYNGPHGESSISLDGHYALPHIHRITEEEMASGNTQPQEKHRQLTARYTTFEEGMRVFFDDIGVTDYADYFPELQSPRLINGN